MSADPHELSSAVEWLASGPGRVHRVPTHFDCHPGGLAAGLIAEARRWGWSPLVHFPRDGAGPPPRPPIAETVRDTLLRLVKRSARGALRFYGERSGPMDWSEFDDDEAPNILDRAAKVVPALHNALLTSPAPSARHHDPAVAAADARDAKTYTRAEVLAFGERVEAAVDSRTSSLWENVFQYGKSVKVGDKHWIDDVNLTALLDAKETR